MKWILAFAGILFLWTSLTQAAFTDRLRTALVENPQTWIEFTDFVNYIEDPTGNMSIRDAVSEFQKQGIIERTNLENNLQLGKTYWLLYALKNNTPKRHRFIIRFGSGNPVTTFQVKQNVFDPLPSFNWQSRELDPSYQYLEMHGNQHSLYLTKIKYQKQNKPFLITINKFENVLNKDAGFVYFGGILFGVLFILAIYYVALGSSLKDPLYLHYFFFLASCCVLVLTVGDGELQYLKPSFLEWLSLSPAYFMILALVTWGQFSKHYLEIPLKNPLLNSIINIVSGVVLASMILVLQGTATQLVAYGALAAFLLVAGAAVWMFLQGSSHARYYLLANSSFIAAGLYYIYLFSNGLPLTERIYYLMQGALFLQVCLLSLGMSRRLSDIQKEKEEALASDLDHQRQAVDHHQQFTRAYARFVPMEFFNLLDKHNILDVQLGDARQHNMTVLFSDIRSYSTLCEKLSSSDSFRMLNEYLGHMGPIIRKAHGFIDKYVGDAIMALFPDSADHAVTGAIEMIRGLRSLNTSREARNEPPIHIGIGIHTGSLVLGTVGEEERMEGTVISDAVNIAARLEQLTRPYNIPIIISQETVDAFRGTTFAYRFLGETRLKGKTEVTKFYEVFQADEENERFIKNKTKSEFEQAVRHYLDGNLSAAAELFKEALSENSNDKPAQYYLSECNLTLSANPHYGQQ